MNTSRTIRTGAVALMTAVALTTGAAGVVAPASADKAATPKPSVKTAPLVFSHYFDKSSALVLPDGSQQGAEVAGMLHVSTEVTLDTDGRASEIDVHANLSDGVATLSASGTTLRVTGSARETKPPTICALPPQLCPLPTRLTFHLSGGTDGPAGGGEIRLTVALTFDDSWHLVDAQPVRGGLA